MGCYERVAHIGFLSLFIIKNRIVSGKNGLVRHMNGLALEIKYLIEPIFHLGFHWCSHVNKTGTQGYKLCVVLSFSSLNGMYR